MSAKRKAHDWRASAELALRALSGIKSGATTFKRTLREVMYGATGFEFERESVHLRADLENLFVFMLAGDTLGVPILPPYYALRLLPYITETMPAWRRRVLRERQAFEGEDFELHGV